MKNIAVVLLSLLLSACAGVPENIKPVTDFELERYLGKWYEIARLDHRFERGLNNVTAVYAMNDDGTVRVINKGYSSKNKEWEEATGKAKFAGSPDVGHLEVSFFGPFYGAYVIFELDKENYQYAFITGSENTLWLLSRTPTVSDELKNHFINTVDKLGYNSDALIFVAQE
ncbi:MAG: lipocalin family protein [Alcanivoracaceae bacterium]|nr:lipocalin family protein [Alcanivoracaceae bacterium]